MKYPSFPTWVAIMLVLAIVVLFAVMLLVGQNHSGEQAVGARKCVGCERAIGLLAHPPHRVFVGRRFS